MRRIAFAVLLLLGACGSAGSSAPARDVWALWGNTPHGVSGYYQNQTVVVDAVLLTLPPGYEDMRVAAEKAAAFWNEAAGRELFVVAAPGA